MYLIIFQLNAVNLQLFMDFVVPLVPKSDEVIVSGLNSLLVRLEYGSGK